MQPGHDDLHVDRLLTNMSIAYVNDMYIATQIFPEVPVQLRSDIVPKYRKSDWFRNEAVRLAPTEAPPVGGYEVDLTQTYYCHEYGIGHLIPDQTRANVDRPFDPDRDGMAWLMDRMLMATEPPSELELFYRFLSEQLQNGEPELSPEDSVRAFRAHQRESGRLRKEIHPAVERFKRGEGRELDYEAVKEEVTRRLAEKGITE